LSGFLLAKSITIKITKSMFFGQTESVVFSRDIFKGAAALEFLLFFVLKDLLCLFKKLVIQSQMRFSVRFR